MAGRHRIRCHVTESLTFAYRAVRQDGRIVRGSLAAPNRAAAANSLADSGLWALELRPQREGADWLHRSRTIPARELALGFRILADLLEAGLPLSRAITAFQDLASPGWRTAMPAIRELIRQGKGLGAALSDAPARIPREILGIIQAGEAGSGLARAVRRAAELTEDSATARAALRAALAYPLILLFAGSIAVAILVGIVLPRFALLLADLGQSLPPTTRVVLGIATGMRRIGPASLLAMTMGAAVGRAAVGIDAGRYVWHRTLLHIPLLGAIRHSAATGRACTALSALLENGVPISAALASAARASGDAALTLALMAAREDVVHGEKLSRALREHAAVTVTANRLVHAGEESGRLSAMLAHAGRLERELAIGRTKAVIRLIEPTMILLFGGIVALVASALLQALYSIRPGA